MIVILIIAVLLLLMLIAGGWYLCDVTLKRGVTVFAAKNNTNDSELNTMSRRAEQYRAFMEDNSADEYMTNDEGMRLHALKITSDQNSDKWIIVCHPYRSRARNMGAMCSSFAEWGYNVLALDARAHGNSNGKMIGMVWMERSDIMLWIEKLLAEHPNAEIALYGVSMGGAAVACVSGEILPPQVKCIIEDCGFSSVLKILKMHQRRMFKLPSFPLLYVSTLICRLRAGYFFGEASAAAQVAKCRLPILMIHGLDDKFVPPEMLNDMYNAAKCEKQKLLIPGAQHGESEAVAPELYRKTIKAFLGKHF